MRIEQILIRIAFYLTLLWTLTAHAELEHINGQDYERPIPQSAVESEDIASANQPPHLEDLPFHEEHKALKHETAPFSVDDAEQLTRQAHQEKNRRLDARAIGRVGQCFAYIREAAEDGKCQRAFFSKDATCNGDEEPTGCFENRLFRRKLHELGYRVTRRSAPTDDYDDDCSALTVTWCRLRAREQ